jgi:hypothetical protein
MRLSYVLLAVVLLVVGLIGGYVVGSGTKVQATDIGTVTVTATSTVTTTSTAISTIYYLVGPQYLNASQAANEGAVYVNVGCVGACNSTASASWYFTIPGMTHFSSQIDVNPSLPGLSASVSSHDGDQIELTISTSYKSNACFEYLLAETQLPPTIYVWYVGQVCPP